ncbi:4-(cytidine 5'-diphospho)-2-C-methyl-D-erythritol kinase [Microbulbifer agarilyticus]|uniref:4-(cytidine 5'-diphospho)-2-C-methyl-D-erythritol kinase n=1 Tax=Microbulbifer agarilyticus TaxID=260552 RepID=UPI001C94DA59|nr:4-(cytidine 5'-diphospho)-2-C-methyl-D-erythritol kinase [Microbulbifer agarilyticus]MBY6190561.1 4-(cytidine 5'-diphospho)-2-C-methyl-D-erythritol kinase [Microbulbifer agarilyticus]MBY6210545.1 4-(cytidine 5'-diphospho)-2-C-methyl-D-erythritol kinase [Microbulbifer agarilyticus]
MNTPSLTLTAPAKLNLMLRILGRREDGYHELQTVFQLLDVGDTMTFSPTNDGQIHLHCPGVDVPPEQNLIVRAARLLQAAALQQLSNRRDFGAKITVDKVLPAGGGIGGGSSDAATTLLALNHLWQCELDLEALAELGRQLGADVPVFVRGTSAFAEGVGEKLTPVAIEPRWYLVLKPVCHVSTAALFSNPRLTRDSAAITLAALRDRQLNSDWLNQYAGNDFQPLVEDLYPEVREAREWLAQYADAFLTGTGACVFAGFESEAAARKVLAARPNGWEGFVAKGADESLSHRQLANFAATV